jgi:hypothetical protein
VLDRDRKPGAGVQQFHVIGPDRFHYAATDRSIESRYGDGGGSILGIQETITYRSPSPSSGPGRFHLGVERPIHPCSHHTTKSDKIRVGDSFQDRPLLFSPLDLPSGSGDETWVSVQTPLMKGLTITEFSRTQSTRLKADALAQS